MTVPAQVLAAVRSIPHPRQETNMTAPRPSPAGLSLLLDQLDEARPLAGQFSKALRDHADDCICDRWVTHHSQMLAVIAGRIIDGEVEARVQAAANRRAAEELEALRARLATDEDAPTDAALEGLDFTLRVLRDRADALASPAPAPQTGEH